MTSHIEVFKTSMIGEVANSAGMAVCLQRLVMAQNDLAIFRELRIDLYVAGAEVLREVEC
jgi:hypothetical protein